MLLAEYVIAEIAEREATASGLGSVLCGGRSYAMCVAGTIWMTYSISISGKIAKR